MNTRQRETPEWTRQVQMATTTALNGAQPIASHQTSFPLLTYTLGESKGRNITFSFYSSRYILPTLRMSTKHATLGQTYISK